MLEPGMSSAFREMKDCYRTVVTDVGAFTTDFGLVEFDTSFKTEHWGKPAIKQHSVRLGIRELDAAILRILDPRVTTYFQEHAQEEWERRKRELYAGRPQRISIGGRLMEIGADLESEAIREEISGFAGRVVDARQDFLKSCGNVRAEEEALTGGGSAIEGLRKELIAGMRQDVKRVHDLWDPAEPEQAVAAGAGRLSALQADSRIRENRTLVRGASAIGGASVYFEA
jgi:hypothetical protein